MLIKICGLMDTQTANLAILAGADYIGLIFSKVSPRKVDIELAKEITKQVRYRSAEVIGVFVDEDFRQMQEIIQILDLHIIQLHGNKVRAYCELLDPSLQIIYVVGNKTNKSHKKLTNLITLPENLNPKRDFLLFEKVVPLDLGFRYFIAGGVNSKNVKKFIDRYTPDGIDISSALEVDLAKKDSSLIHEFIKLVKPDRFGKFGGNYVPELLIAPLEELCKAYNTITKTNEFQTQFLDLLNNHIGRPTALTQVKNFAEKIGVNQVFLKREDLLHTGAHKINNAIGQCLLAKKMSKTRIIAETGAGQHGLATATACAIFNLDCVIYMGSVDIKRQAPNVEKMQLLGAKVIAVNNGSATLKDAVNEAMRDWAHNFATSHYCLGSALGPFPFPQMVADFQSIIGREAKRQFLDRTGSNPSSVIACVGGGSNAIGIFSAYIPDESVQLIGVEAGGTGPGLGYNAARFQEGRPGVLHGTYSYLLQTAHGQIAETSSISAGLDYPGVGPHHAHLFKTKRVTYVSVNNDEALKAFYILSKTEGIIPALESAHALAYLIKIAKDLPSNAKILINLSGRGDKDMPQIFSLKGIN